MRMSKNGNGFRFGFFAVFASKGFGACFGFRGLFGNDPFVPFMCLLAQNHIRLKFATGASALSFSVFHTGDFFRCNPFAKDMFVRLGRCGFRRG